MALLEGLVSDRISPDVDAAVPLSERLAFLGERALATEKMDMSMTSYMLLSRLAYTDIFASVINVQDASPEPIPMRQWTEAERPPCDLE